MQTLVSSEYCVSFFDITSDTDWKCPLCVAEDFMKLRLDSLLNWDYSRTSIIRTRRDLSKKSG